MKKTTAIVLALLLAGANQAMACSPIGWRLVGERQISAFERQCIYEKNGATVSILVTGFCPLSPC